VICLSLTKIFSTKYIIRQYKLCSFIDVTYTPQLENPYFPDCIKSYWICHVRTVLTVRILLLPIALNTLKIYRNTIKIY